jgi:hypothetical protein
MAQWCLPDSSGRDRLIGEFRDIYKGPDGQAILCVAISISGEFWRLPISDPQLADDYKVCLPQVLCNWQAVDELILELGEWLDRPKPIKIDLASKIRGHQTFSIEFSKTHRLITTGEKPACTVTYSGTNFLQGVWSFVVDQSCIRIFHDELRAAFRDVTAQSSP